MMASYIAVKVYGPGHVIAYNYVANFHDGIDIETYGNPDGSAAVGRPEVSAAGVLGPAAGLDRLLQQLHDQLPRQPVRDRRQHAQHPRDAEHDDQLRVARVLQPAGDRRAGLLDPQHRLSRAGRIDAADRRLGGRALLQQHDPVGDRRRQRTSNVHWRNNLFLGENSRAGDLQRQHVHQLHARRTTTASGRIRARRTSFQWNSPPSGVPADYSSQPGPYGGAWRPRQFATLAEYSRRPARISTACSWTTTSS